MTLGFNQMKHIMSNKKKKSGNSYTTFQQYMNRFTEFFDSEEILEDELIQCIDTFKNTSNDKDYKYKKNDNKNLYFRNNQEKEKPIISFFFLFIVFSFIIALIALYLYE